MKAIFSCWFLLGALAFGTPRVIQFKEREIEFPVSRADISVGVAILNILVPDEDWTIKVGGAQERLGGFASFKSVSLIPMEGNRFKLPPVTITANEEEPGPICFGLKVWFKEITNVHDSPFYVNVPDRYSLVSWCSTEKLRDHPRFKQNPVATLKEFQERLKKPFPLKLRDYQMPWRPSLICDDEGTLYFHSLILGRRKTSAYAGHHSDIWKLSPDGALKRLQGLDRRTIYVDPFKIPTLDKDPAVARIYYLSTRADALLDGKGGYFVKQLTYGGKAELKPKKLLHQIMHQRSDGVANMVVGSLRGHRDGKGEEVQFSTIGAMTLSPKGDLFFADVDLENGSWIRKMTRDGVVSTIAGGAEVGFADGDAKDARFHAPNALAVASDETIYVADPVNNRVRRIDPNGKVATILGPKQAVQPSGVALGPKGQLFVLDGGQKMARVRQLLPNGELKVLAKVDFQRVIDPHAR